MAEFDAYARLSASWSRPGSSGGTVLLLTAAALLVAAVLAAILLPRGPLRNLEMQLREAPAPRSSLQLSSGLPPVPEAGSPAAPAIPGAPRTLRSA